MGQGCFLERRDSFKRYRSRRDPGLALGDRVTVHTWTEFNIEPEGKLEVEDDAWIGIGTIILKGVRIGAGRASVPERWSRRMCRRARA